MKSIFPFIFSGLIILGLAPSSNAVLLRQSEHCYLGEANSGSIRDLVLRLVELEKARTAYISGTDSDVCGIDSANIEEIDSNIQSLLQRLILSCGKENADNAQSLVNARLMELSRAIDANDIASNQNSRIYKLTALNLSYSLSYWQKFSSCIKRK